MSEEHLTPERDDEPPTIERHHPFAAMPNRLLLDPAISSHAKVAYGVLATYAGPGRLPFPGLPRVAEQMGVSADTARRALKDLADTGWVERVRRFRSDGGETSPAWRLAERAGQFAGGARTGARGPRCTGATPPVAPVRAELELDEQEERTLTGSLAGSVVAIADRRTAQGLVAVWVEGYREAHGGQEPPRPLMGQVAGKARDLAKTAEPERWAEYLERVRAAGRAAFPDMVKATVWVPGEGRRDRSVMHEIDRLHRLEAEADPWAVAEIEGGQR